MAFAPNSSATMPPSRRISSSGVSAVSSSHAGSLLSSYREIAFPSMAQNWDQVTALSGSPASSGKKPYQAARSHSSIGISVDSSFASAVVVGVIVCSSVPQADRETRRQIARRRAANRLMMP